MNVKRTGRQGRTEEPQAGNETQRCNVPTTPTDSQGIGKPPSEGIALVSRERCLQRVITRVHTYVSTHAHFCSLSALLSEVNC